MGFFYNLGRALGKAAAGSSKSSSSSSSPSSNKYMSFGRYPQSLKSDNVSIVGHKSTVYDYYNTSVHSHPENRNYIHRVDLEICLGSDGCDYVKVPCRVNGNDIVDIYYKIEPIRWQIMSEYNGTALLVSTKVIDNNVPFQSKPKLMQKNSWANSEIRAWMNSTFYNFAFTDSEKSKMITTTVEKESGVLGINRNVDDKVWLLSKSEVKRYYGNHLQKYWTYYARLASFWYTRYFDFEYCKEAEFNSDFGLRSFDCKYDSDSDNTYCDIASNCSLATPVVNEVHICPVIKIRL